MPKVVFSQGTMPDLLNTGIMDIKGSNIVGGIRVKPGFDYWWFLEYGTAGNEDEFANIKIALDRPAGIKSEKSQTGPYPISARDRGVARKSPRARPDDRPVIQKHWPEVSETIMGPRKVYKGYDAENKKRITITKQMSVTWVGKSLNPYRGGLLVKPPRKARRRGGMYVSKSGKLRAWWVKPGTDLAKKYESRGYVWVENQPKPAPTSHKGFLRFPSRRRSFNSGKRWIFRRTVTHPGVKSKGIIRRNISRWVKEVERSGRLKDAVSAQLDKLRKGATISDFIEAHRQALNIELGTLKNRIVADVPLGKDQDHPQHLKQAFEVVDAKVTVAKSTQV